MTPGEVRQMSVPEYLSFVEYMRSDFRARERAARQRKKR